jgi:hypothetical protein
MYNTKIFMAFLSICNILRYIPIIGAQSPPKFTPVVSNPLNVVYGPLEVTPAGVTVPGSGQYHLF